MTPSPMEVEAASTTCSEVLETIERAVIADRDFLETVLTGSLAKGHVLLEDVPGTGKTLTARSLARALGLEFNRIQFTPDLLPSDITGSHVFNEQTGEFEFNPGPIFAHVVLADEINRAPPKTQAALLEAMGEKQVSIGGETKSLPEPFFVIATQNPVEQEGTFELPEAQRDRFIIKTSIGYPDAAGERELLDRRTSRSTATPEATQVVDSETFNQLQEVPEYVQVDDKLKDYIVDLGRRTREHQAVKAGVSPRGIQRLLEASRARAVISGRNYVVPDDIKSIAPPVITHRLVLTADATVEGISKRDVTKSVLNSVNVPAMDAV